MDYFERMGGRTAYEVCGQGETTLVIDTCIASCSAEWRHIARDLQDDIKVVIYDRAGYGESTSAKAPRTPQTVAAELYALLQSLDIKRDIVLLGHSQGGLYAAQYALDYPDGVKGLILLDPATPFDREFKKQLSEEEYRMSGVDKTGSYRMGKVLSSLHLAGLLRPLFKKSPPFCYHSFDSAAESYLLRSLCRADTYRTALREYHWSHDAEGIGEVTDAIKSGALGGLPLMLITHGSEFYEKELREYAGLDEGTAKKIESLWQDLMLRYAGMSSKSVLMRAKNSGHYIHLTDYPLVKQVVLSMR